MLSIDVFNKESKKVKSIEVPESIFSYDMNEYHISDAIRYQVAKHYEHRVAIAKTRTEVTATGKKIYKQKGTGQARHGDIKAPIFVGGGKAHGPRPRFVRRYINKKVMRSALLSALTMKRIQNLLYVVDDLGLLEVKTKSIQNILSHFSVDSVLFVNEDAKPEEKNFNISARNIKTLKTIRPEGINPFDILKYKHLIVSEGAVHKFVERFSQPISRGKRIKAIKASL